MSDQLKILVIGAGGQVTSRTVKALGDHQGLSQGGCHFVLADIFEEAAAQTAAAMPSGACETRKLDIYDVSTLEHEVAASDFVIHGAGPFHKTARLVREACLKSSTDYMDIDDDVESSLDAIALDQRAKDSNAALYPGCGASPGLTNILARQAIDLLDEVHDVEVAWCTGDEDEMQIGRAVLEHTMHIGAGDCVTWRNGQQVTHRSFDATTLFPLGADKIPTRLYECAHPETIALPYSYPHLRNVTCWGAIIPTPLNGVLKGVARAEHAGKISMDEACGFFQDVVEGRLGSLEVWHYALGGAIDQIRKGESSVSTFVAYVAAQLRGKSTSARDGIGARASGVLEGRPAEVLITSNDHEAGSAIDTMEAATGLSQAAFFLQAIDRTKSREPGCHFPEAWSDPDRFLRDLAKFGDRTSADIICEPDIRFT